MADPPSGPPDAEALIDWKAVHDRARRLLVHRMGGFRNEDVEDAAQKACEECVLFVRKDGAPRSIDAIIYVIAVRIAADEIKRRVRDRRVLHDAQLPDALYPPQDEDLWEAIETAVFLIRGYCLLTHAPCVEILDARLQGVTLESHAQSRGMTPAQVRQRWARCMAKVREAVRRGRLQIPLDLE